MHRPIVLIGYGGHGAVIAEILQLTGITILGYFDRGRRLNDPFNLVYLGEESNVSKEMPSDTSFFISIGDNRRREKLSEWANEQNLSVASCVVHPHARISAFTSIGSGSMVGVQAVVNIGAKIGSGVILNTSSIIEHDCTVGDYSHVAPGAKVLGGVRIGKGCLIGSGAVILPGLEIGDYATVGAGAVVSKDVLPGLTVKGIPAKK